MLLATQFAYLNSVSADVIKSSEHFTSVGEFKSFSLDVPGYEDGFTYDIYYYIPKMLEKKSNVRALIFNHGGGQSTLTRDDSIEFVTLYYKNSLVRLANELGIVVVLPSANGLNWGGHTRLLMRNLLRIMRKDLSVDPNKIGLSGHSMGGMGITRAYSWLADEFSFFLPMSSGMPETLFSINHLNKVFNVPYVHLQGINDKLQVFVSHCYKHYKKILELETLYKQASKFKMIFHKGDHDIDYELFKSHARTLSINSTRNLYQRELWGSIQTVRKTLNENNIRFPYVSESRYFWIEAIQSNLSIEEVFHFHAKIQGQTILLATSTMPTQTEIIRIYLHSKMIDLEQDIHIVFNGKRLLTRKAQKGSLRNMDANDPGFNFEGYIDLRI